MPGVIVSGVWSQGSANPVACTTNSIGSCILARNNLLIGSHPSVTFTVMNASLASYAYDPGQNHDPEADSNGTIIVIAQP